MHGHAYDLDNTYVDSWGKQHCRTCNRDSHAGRYTPRISPELRTTMRRHREAIAHGRALRRGRNMPQDASSGPLPPSGGNGRKGTTDDVELPQEESASVAEDLGTTCPEKIPLPADVELCVAGHKLTPRFVTFDGRCLRCQRDRMRASRARRRRRPPSWALQRRETDATR